jgi:hypothetical protein
VLNHGIPQWIRAVLGVGYQLVHEQPLVAAIQGYASASVDVDHLAAHSILVVCAEIRIAQIQGQDDVVLLDIGAELQQRGVVQPQFEPRQKTRVAMINAVGAARRGHDVAARAKVWPCFSERSRRS